jgi:hypothetical protein
VTRFADFVKYVYGGVTEAADLVVVLVYVVLILDIAYQAYRGTLPANPIQWRAFDGHRILLVTALASSYFFVNRVLGVGKVVALLGTMFLFATHETFWWITDVAYYFLNRVVVSPLWFLGTFEVSFAYFYIVWWRASLPLPRRFVLIMIGYYAAWFAVGFPVTVNYQYLVSGAFGLMGATPFFNVLWVSGVEYASWGVAIVAYWVTMLKRSRTMSKKLDERFNSLDLPSSGRDESLTRN